MFFSSGVSSFARTIYPDIYLLLDLLKHTDLGSPSREVVEGAMSVAMRIAQRCDEAQGHERFLRA